MNRAGKLSVAAGLSAYLWLIAASALYCLAISRFDLFAFPFTQWIEAASWWNVSRSVRVVVVAAGVVPLIVAGLVAAAVFHRRGLRRLVPGSPLRPVEDGVTDNHGHAAWMTMREALRTFPGPAPGYGGVVVGEAYRVDEDIDAHFDPSDRRTWGMGGKATLLIDPCTSGPTHSLLFAGSGRYKSVSAVSTVLTWIGNSVILDPSCEIGPMVADTLQTEHGKKVHFLRPERPDGVTAWGFNALDWIDIHDPLAEMHVHTVVNWIFREPTGNEAKEDLFFRPSAKDMVASLLAHMLWDDNATVPKTLQTLRLGVVTPQDQMRQVLRGIHQSSNNAMARQLAGSLMDLVDETFSGIYGTATKGTSWLSQAAFAELVSGNAFRTSDLVLGNITVFVEIPLSALMNTPEVARVVVGSLLNAVYEADGNVNGRVLFLLDEVARLGYMKVIETARDVGRKYGVTLHLCYQSTGQLEEQWGPYGKRSWYDGVSWRAYAAVQDLDTAREISATCGNHGVLAYSEGENSGKQNRAMAGAGSRSKGRNTNVHEISRPLIRPEEIMQDARDDELFVIARGRKPLRCGRAISFRRPELIERMERSRFA